MHRLQRGHINHASARRTGSAHSARDRIWGVILADATGTSGSYAPAEAIARSALTQLGAGAEPLQHAFGASQLLFGARTAIASANLVATVLPAVWAVVRPTSGTITGRRPVAGLRLRPGTGSSGRRRLT